jgi:hypothetical protein
LSRFFKERREFRTFIVVSGVLDDGGAAKKARNLFADQRPVNKPADG